MRFRFESDDCKEEEEEGGCKTVGGRVGVIDYTIRSLPALERKRSMVMKIIRRAWIKLLELGNSDWLYACVSLGV